MKLENSYFEIHYARYLDLWLCVRIVLLQMCLFSEIIPLCESPFRHSGLFSLLHPCVDLLWFSSSFCSLPQL